MQIDENLYHQVINKINENFSSVNNILNLYLKKPDEKNIHDIRKSIRKADSAYMALPKKYRNKKRIRNFIDKSKKFFKLNSKIRDYDIYLQKLENYKKNSTVFPITDTNKNITSEIQNYRKSKLENAKVQAEKLKVLECPNIPLDNRRINTQIENRFKKITKNFNQKIRKNFLKVINDETKVEELHTLRKDCKRLRYLLELKSKDEKDDDLSKSIIQLENIQDTLGEIHDCDTTLSFFKKLKNYPETKPLINKESQFRNNIYKKFADKHKNSIQEVSFI